MSKPDERRTQELQRQSACLQAGEANGGNHLIDLRLRRGHRHSLIPTDVLSNPDVSCCSLLLEGGSQALLSESFRPIPACRCCDVAQTHRWAEGSQR